MRSLAALGRRGKRSVEVALPNLRRAADAVRPLPEAAKNLAIILEHLDDPEFAAEKDPRAPRRNGGFTGLEALLRYFFAQSQAINVFDDDSHLLKIVLRPTSSARTTPTPSAHGRSRAAAGRGSGPTSPASTGPIPRAPSARPARPSPP